MLNEIKNQSGRPAENDHAVGCLDGGQRPPLTDEHHIAETQAVALPIPEVAPVIMQVFPFMTNFFCSMVKPPKIVCSIKYILPV